AAAAELAGIAGALDRGVLEVVSDFIDQREEMATVLGMVEASGRPLSISIAQADRRPNGWSDLLEMITAANERGLEVKAQVAARAIGIMLGHQATMSPLGSSPTARKLGALPFAERIEQFRRGDVRDAVLAEVRENPNRYAWSRIFVLGDPPDYEPAPETSIEAMAQRAGVAPEALAYDLLLGDDGRALLYSPLLNYADGDLDVVRQMLTHEHTVVGLGDGGAHVGTICDASFPTTMLTHWVRDRSRGARLGLAQAVAKQTSKTAQMIGLLDRGVLAPGRRADVNVIDLDNLTLHPPTIAFDLPAGGKRLLQRADGYLHTVVAGQETYTNGEHTGALPGRLVRGARPVPTGA
ncbi:MAG: amidohydrolase family protein, partial [Ilumatobacteraceae bacterium]